MEKLTNHAPKLVQIPEDVLESLLVKAEQNPTEFFKVQSARIATATAYQKCAKAAVRSILWLSLSTLFSAYGDMSARVMTTLRSQVPSMEVYSIDAAFQAAPSTS